MKLACIIFQSGDYERTAIEAETYRATLRAMGHGFDILFSTRDTGVSSARFQVPEKIFGRHESSILVDGMVSHHPNRCGTAGTWLTKNYDAVLFMGLCPYPTKSYGSEPHWLGLYKAIKIPKIGKVIGIMPGTDWPSKAINDLDAVYFSQDAFVPSHEFGEPGDPTPNILPTPFLRPVSDNSMRTPKRSVIWSGGWNRVDGIVEFINEIPKIAEHSDVTLTGLGSQYFRQRKKDPWHRAVNQDSYAEYDGIGPADSVGRSPFVGVTPKMAESWAAVDLVGLDRGDTHHSYSEGMYTPSMIEALYKGTWPVVSGQCYEHSPIPSKFLWGNVLDQEDISPTIKAIKEPLAGTKLGDRAKEWVIDTHDSYANSATLIQDIGGMI